MRDKNTEAGSSVAPSVELLGGKSSEAGAARSCYGHSGKHPRGKAGKQSGEAESEGTHFTPAVSSWAVAQAERFQARGEKLSLIHSVCKA